MIVFERTVESYCRWIHVLSPSSGVPRRLLSARSGSSGASQSTARWRSRRSAGRGRRPIVDRRAVDQRLYRHVRDGTAAKREACTPAIGYPADLRRFEAPSGEDLDHRLLLASLGDEDHPFLRLGEHDLVGRQRGLAQRHQVEVDVHPRAASGGHLEAGAGQSGGAHVLDPEHDPAPHRLQARLEQDLLREGIAHLYRGPLRLALGVEGLRRHRGAVNAIAAGTAARVENRVAGAGSRGGEDPVLPAHAERERVHQDVAVVGR